MSAPADPGTRAVLWRFAPMIYGPTILFSLGEGALLPLLPVIAGDLGADVPQAALVASMIVVAQLIGNVPAGWAVDRFGERATMVVSGSLALIGVLGVIWAPHLGWLIGAAFMMGLCASAFGLARHAFMTRRAPFHYRARALALLGGSFRFGMFLGPFIGAGLVWLTGVPTSAAWFFAGCLVALVLLVFFGTDPEAQLAREGLAPQRASYSPDDDVDDDTSETVGTIPPVERIGVFRTMWRYRGALARLGVAAACMAAIRHARMYVLPLWGVSIMLDGATISLIVGIGGAIEFALFYTSGQVMDRWGRMWAALPSMLLMSIAFLGLAFTHDVDNRTAWFVAATIVAGIGNGLSSGILMTLGADLAPPDNPAPFLGGWRMFTDGGGAAAPLLVTAISAAVSISFATAIIGVIGFIGAAAFARYVPRYVPRRR